MYSRLHEESRLIYIMLFACA